MSLHSVVQATPFLLRSKEYVQEQTNTNITNMALHPIVQATPLLLSKKVVPEQTNTNITKTALHPVVQAMLNAMLPMLNERGGHKNT
ncbi:unnamed protein product [Heligmosomoides polygyrus]|uniref:Uncharacterized protein n=1 Tax=Heligmosomoides polygyrus TaxID=6339 RepID=A0A183GEI3_HELPZ|nr:unnamed protein product [Heligmosomoides polygyrus]